MAAYSTYTDQELTVLLKEADQTAFTEIYNRYWAEMYYHTYRMLKEEESSMDVVQDVFSNLWLKAPALNINTRLAGHLYISVRNKVFNLIAQNKLRNDYLNSIIAYADEVETSHFSLYEEKELLEAVEAAIQELPPKMRTIFELSRKDNLSHKEIARLLNISDQTVKKQVQNALKILKPKLQFIEAGIFAMFFIR